MTKNIFIAGAVLSSLSVAIGAFGAHSLKQILLDNQTTETFKTAVDYQFYHSLALLGLAWASSYWADINFKLNYLLFIIGILLFSFSLYIYAVTKITLFAMITPIGGIVLLFSWFNLSYKIWQSSDKPQAKG